MIAPHPMPAPIHSSFRQAKGQLSVRKQPYIPSVEVISMLSPRRSSRKPIPVLGYVYIALIFLGSAYATHIPDDGYGSSVPTPAEEKAFWDHHPCGRLVAPEFAKCLQAEADNILNSIPPTSTQSHP